MLPSLILFSTSYLLWEEHSLGWKLSIAICGITALIAVTNLTTLEFMLPIAILSGDYAGDVPNSQSETWK